MNVFNLLVFFLFIAAPAAQAHETLTTTETDLLGIIVKIDILPHLAWGYLHLVGRFESPEELVDLPFRDVSFHTIYASSHVSISDLAVGTCVLFDLKTSKGLREWASLQKVITCPTF